jgi:hypothetical protein
VPLDARDRRISARRWQGGAGLPRGVTGRRRVDRLHAADDITAPVTASQSLLEMADGNRDVQQALRRHGAR